MLTVCPSIVQRSSGSGRIILRTKNTAVIHGVMTPTDLQARESPSVRPRMVEGRMISQDTRVPIPSQARSGYAPKEGGGESKALAVLATRKVTTTSTLIRIGM